MNISENYEYEIELIDGTILTKTNNFDKSKVLRVSYIPNNIILPRHDLIFTDFKLIKRFSRTFISYGIGVKERIHICITDKFRFHLFSISGKTLITEKDYEFHL